MIHTNYKGVMKLTCALDYFHHIKILSEFVMVSYTNMVLIDLIMIILVGFSVFCFTSLGGIYLSS